MPPSERGKGGTLGRRRADDLRALPIELQVKDLGARLVGHARTVHVQADEQVRLAVVGDRRALVEPERAVVVARQDHAQAESILDHCAQATGDVERQLFFLDAFRTADADVVAAVTRVDHDRLPRAMWQRCAARGSGIGVSARSPGLELGGSGIRDSERRCRRNLDAARARCCWPS